MSDVKFTAKDRQILFGIGANENKKTIMNVSGLRPRIC